eukprot:gene46286-32612_t
MHCDPTGQIAVLAEQQAQQQQHAPLAAPGQPPPAGLAPQMQQMSLGGAPPGGLRFPL